jgi:hypothetical protein
MIPPDFAAWMAISPVFFFPEYTNHGPAHFSDVLATAMDLMSDLDGCGGHDVRYCRARSRNARSAMFSVRAMAAS